MTTSDTPTRGGGCERASRVTVAGMTTNTVPPRDWGETVPLPELARVADVSSDDLYNAIRRGLLDPGGTPGKRYRPIMVPRDQATSVLMAAAISVAAGVVFATALRVVLAGATFPLPGTDAAA